MKFDDLNHCIINCINSIAPIYENNYVKCDSCSDFVAQNEYYCENGLILCNNCYNNYYSKCYLCGKLLDKDFSSFYENENSYVCKDCYLTSNNTSNFVYPIHTYGYKPRPLFHGTSNRYFGIELEIDCGGDSNYNASQLLYTANQGFYEYNMYIKHDGSIRCGFEIVSHPMSLRWHTSVMPWSSILESAESLGYKSHNTSTCGLHIHVNRDSLSTSIIQQDEIIARIIYFIESNWIYVYEFSRRDERQINSWSKRYGKLPDVDKLWKRVLRKKSDRKHCVNILNKFTVEFRLFRGTLNYNTFIAAIQFIDVICELSILTDKNKIINYTWHDMLNFLSNFDYPELVLYLKEKNLYNLQKGGE